MKMIHRCLTAIGLAAALAFSSLCFATERAVEYVCTALDGGYGSAVAKLQADLTYHADAKAAHGSSVSADLIAQGHGYRQSSAIELIANTGSPSVSLT